MSTTEPEPEVEPEVVPEDDESSPDETEPIDYPGEAGDRGENWQPDEDPEAAPVEEQEVGYEGER